MGLLEDIDTSKAPTIPEFFRGKSVFITGGSGFMGQALVEKLLYSCPELDSIFLLMRGKRGVPPGERLEKLYNSSCFDRLRKEKPNIFVQKVHIIPGDVLELGLGLSDADRTLLINKVHLVFNVAASVRFDDPLTHAAKMNIRGTRELVELAKNFKNLLSFVHVSTCYSNCKNGIIDEVLYPPLADWREVLDICETMDEHTIRTLTPKYLNGMPNTYVFTKQLAEHLVSEQRGRLPVVILRPSIVVGSIQEPAPGWVNNFNGPVGLTIALGKGIKRSIYGKSDVRCNYVPLDVCIRNFIVTAWARGITELKPNVDVPIYNICSMDEDMLTMEELIKIGAALDEQNRLDGIVWHVRPPSVTDVFLVHFFRLMVYNVLLSIIIDFILWISGQQPRLLKIQRKIYIADVALFYFVSRNWRMINTKFLNIRNIIKPEDRESFYYVVEKLFEENFLEICINGGKKFLLHDDKKDPVECKAHAFSIANVVSQQSFVTRIGLNQLISLTNSKPLAKMTAKEFMMGYKSELMTLGNTFMPGWISFDKLGLIDRMYDFEGDYETIFTGEHDVSTSGLIDTYRGSTDLPQWEGKHCSSIQYASDGTKFRGGVGMNESLLFFRKSLCRPAPMIAKKVGVKSNLNAVMYSFPEHMMDNGKYEDANKCFCRNGKCLPEGLIDVSQCYYGFPIALSYPHFYKGDAILSEKVEGLNPNREEHETRFWIQPDSGLPLDVSTKFQINMALEDISNIRNTERFSNMYLPLLWFDIRMYSLPPSMEKRFNLYLNILPVGEQVFMYLLFVAGAALIILSVYRLTFKVMFKSFDGKKNKTNITLAQDLWIDKKKNRNDKDNIYAPCEVPLNETDTDDLHFDEDKRPTVLKLERIKELSSRLTDKVYDSVGSMKDKVKDLPHVRNIFNNVRQDSFSLLPKGETVTNDNEGFKSDSSDNENDYKTPYHVVKQSDSDDDCRYLEVVDDEFVNSTTKFETDRSKQLVELDLNQHRDDQLIIDISD